MKIFISGIDSQLGQSLVQLFRNDHLKVEGYNTFEGTIVEKFSERGLSYFPQGDTSLIPEIVKAASSSEIVFLDLVKNPKQTEPIIRCLKNCTAPMETKRIIGISNYCTWANTSLPSYQHTRQKLETDDLLKLLTEGWGSLGQQKHTKKERFTDSQYRSRMPHHSYSTTHQLEQLLLQDSHNKLVCTIICSGLIYGAQYSEFLQNLNKVLVEKTGFQRYGQGLNIVPTIHISDLISMIDVVVNTKDPKPFYIALDDGQDTQAAISQMFADQFECKVVESEINYLDQKQTMWTLEALVKRSTQLDQIKWVSKQGLVKNRNRLREEIQNYYDIPFHVVLLSSVEADAKVKCKQQLAKYLGLKTVDLKAICQCLRQQEQNQQANEWSQIRQLIKLQRGAYEARLAEAKDKSKQKKDATQELTDQYRYSQNLISKACRKMLDQKNLFGYMLDLKSVGPEVLEVITQTIVFQAGSEDPSHIVYNSEAYQRLIRNHEPQLKRGPEQSVVNAATSTSKAQDFESTSLSNMRREEEAQVMMQSDSFVNCDSNNSKINLKQYIMDLVIPSINYAIVRINKEKPEKIMESFVNFLKDYAIANTEETDKY